MSGATSNGAERVFGYLPRHGACAHTMKIPYITSPSRVSSNGYCNGDELLSLIRIWTLRECKCGLFPRLSDSRCASKSQAGGFDARHLANFPSTHRHAAFYASFLDCSSGVRFGKSAFAGCRMMLSLARLLSACRFLRCLPSAQQSY